MDVSEGTQRAVDVDAVTADLAAAVCPSDQRPLQAAAVALVMLAAFAVVTAGVGVLSAASVAGAGFVAAVTVLAVRRRRRRRLWLRVGAYSVAEFAVATIWLARTGFSRLDTDENVARVTAMCAGGLCVDGMAAKRMVTSIRLNFFRFNRDTGDDDRSWVMSSDPRTAVWGAFSRVELVAVAALASSERLRVLWQNCTPSVAVTRQSDVAIEVTDACAGVPEGVLEVAAGLAAGSYDTHTVFEALELAELVLCDMSDGCGRSPCACCRGR